MADHSNSPFLNGEVSKNAGAVARHFRGASIAAHRGSIPRNSSKFKLGDKLKAGREKKVAGLRQFSQINGVAKPRSTKGTRLDGYTTD